MSHQTIGAIVSIVGLIAGFSCPVCIVLLVLRYRRYVTELKLKTITDLAQRGMEVPMELLLNSPRPPGNSDLRFGMVLAFFGTGALLFALTLPEHPAWGLGLLPLFTGLGFLVTWKVGRPKAASGNGG